MSKQTLLQQTLELRDTMNKAASIIDKLNASIPERQPAIEAQCNVMRIFLWQMERQEQLISEMVNQKLKG